MAGFDRGDRGERGGARGGNRREERARAAAAHTEEQERRFGKEIEASAKAMLRIDGMPKAEKAPAAPVSVDAAEPAADADATAPAEDAVLGASASDGPAAVEAADVAAELDASGTASSTEPAPKAKAFPTVTVVDQDGVAAILERGRGRAQFCDLAILDFASFTHPGGGYDRGSMAQEESLCAESFLYNVLSRNKDWYAENRRRNINCNLYRERALVVPAVRFARGKTHAYADVIVAAAPNADRARSEYNVKPDALERAMRNRIRFVLSIADRLGHEKLILGAYGCGVFGWDPEAVAEMFRGELAGGDHIAREVVFAIPRVRYNENLAVFKHAFSAFPERPAASFDEAKAARDAATAAAAEDGNDEDDWRKYL